jgi:hypothetical protein
LGVYGSRTAAPSVESRELSSALLRVLEEGPEATRMKQKAKELDEITGKVRVCKKACEKITELLEALCMA